jgi:hypothetical protein
MSTLKWKAFRQWQQRPSRVPTMTGEHHRCYTCGHEYQGNYCPCCGQSARIGRYSFKNALLLFLDVWGVGNRGMFRSIRDLVLRPGYMIRDYLSGMQMAYFPPFKMFFLLCTLSILVDTGLNIQGIDRAEKYENEYMRILGAGLDFIGNRLGVQKEQPEGKVEEKPAEEAKEWNEAKMETKKKAHSLIDVAFEWGGKHGAVTELIFLMLFSVPLWLLFRHGPATPDLRFSECFVAMVYIINMLLIYSILPSLLCFSPKVEVIYNLLSLLLAVVAIKQLTGYSLANTVWRILVSFIPFVITILLFIVGTFYCIYAFELISNSIG